MEIQLQFALLMLGIDPVKFSNVIVIDHFTVVSSVTIDL